LTFPPPGVGRELPRCRKRTAQAPIASCRFDGIKKDENQTLGWSPCCLLFLLSLNNNKKTHGFALCLLGGETRDKGNVANSKQRLCCGGPICQLVHLQELLILLADRDDEPSTWLSTPASEWMIPTRFIFSWDHKREEGMKGATDPQLI